MTGWLKNIHLSEFCVTSCCMNVSAMGRNVQYYCDRFGGRLHDVINSTKKRTVLLADDRVNRARMIQELVMVRNGLLCLSESYFAPADVDAFIAQLCVDRFLS